MIRFATLDDVPALVELARAMHAESPVFSVLRFDGEILAGNFRTIIQSSQGFARVFEVGGKVAGGMVAAAVPHFCSPDLVACDVGLFVHPEHRGSSAAVRLLTEYRNWAEGIGAALIQFGVMTGVAVERTQSMCERLGWKQQGVVLCA